MTVVGTPLQLRTVQTMEAAERQEVVAHGQKDLGGALLHHDDDALANAERIAIDVHARHLRLCPTSRGSGSSGF